MTEQEWLACTDPTPMLEFLRGKASDRKLRLFAVACSRHLRQDSTPGRILRAVETAERFADGLATEQDLRRAHSMAYEAAHAAQRRGSRGRLLHRLLASEYRLFFAANTAHPHKPFLIGRLRLAPHDADMRAIGPQLLRCIFGNPFRPVTIPATWLMWNEGIVPKFAQAVYAERAFDRLPVLADALEEAGCDDAEVLAHLRGPGPHARGCFVLDVLLQKE